MKVIVMTWMRGAVDDAKHIFFCEASDELSQETLMDFARHASPFPMTIERDGECSS